MSDVPVIADDAPDESPSPDEVNGAAGPAEPAPANAPVAVITIEFNATGNMTTRWMGAQVSHLWAAAELLRNLADARWSETLANQQREAAELAAAMAALRGPTDHLGKGGRPRRS